MQDYVEERTVALSVKAVKLTGKGSLPKLCARLWQKSKAPPGGADRRADSR